MAFEQWWEARTGDKYRESDLFLTARAAWEARDEEVVEALRVSDTLRRMVDEEHDEWVKTAKALNTAKAEAERLREERDVLLKDVEDARAHRDAWQRRTTEARAKAERLRESRDAVAINEAAALDALRGLREERDAMTEKADRYDGEVGQLKTVEMRLAEERDALRAEVETRTQQAVALQAHGKAMEGAVIARARQSGWEAASEAAAVLMLTATKHEGRERQGLAAAIRALGCPEAEVDDTKVSDEALGYIVRRLAEEGGDERGRGIVIPVARGELQAHMAITVEEARPGFGDPEKVVQAKLGMLERAFGPEAEVSG